MIGDSDHEDTPGPVDDPAIQTLLSASDATTLSKIAQKIIAAEVLARVGAEGRTAIHVAARKAPFGGTDIPLTDAAVTALQGAVRQALPKPRCNLPPEAAHFKGRGRQEAALLHGLRHDGGIRAITAMKGIGGIGASTLAVRVARQLVLHYPAAQILVNLRGTDTDPPTPRAVMEDVIRRFELGAHLPDDDHRVSEIYQDKLMRHKSLLILDNARDDRQVQTLAPPPPSAAIVTSRRPLDLPAGLSHALDNLGRADAVALLADIFARRAPANLPPKAALQRLAVACMGNPLALTVVGIYAADRAALIDLARLSEQILERHESLRLTGVADHGVKACLGLCLEGLTAEAAGLAERWRDLAVFPADFDAAAAAAVWGEDAEAGAPSRILAALTAAGFLQAAGGPARFRLHDLMRDLARLDQPDNRFAAASARHGAHFKAVLSAADERYCKGGAQNVADGLALYHLEQANIRTGQARAVAAMREQASAAAGDLVYQYVNMGVHLLSLQLHPREWILWGEAALAGARLSSNRRGAANVLGNLGLAHAGLGEMDKAIGYYQQQLVTARGIDDRRGAANALGNLGNAYARLGRTAKAIDHYRRHLAIAREIGDGRGEGGALGNLGNAYARLGQTERAIEHHQQALAVFREFGDRQGAGNALGNLGNAHADHGETARAIDYYQQQLVIARGIDDRRGAANALANLGLAHETLGQVAEAREAWTAALALFATIDDPNAEEVRQWLATLQA
ncbi:MAG: tetratricopeptide repeat protein [Proteobacteria bacterium]|nr:tetratricopeptide repeat protein [Pseudomonadota bacterium]